jgi:hypothetical protein
VTQVQLEAVGAGAHGETGTIGVVAGDPADVRLGGRAHHLQAEHAVRRERLRAVGPAVGDGAGVTELGRDRRTLGVDGVGEPPEPRDSVGTQIDLMAVLSPFGRDGEVGHGRHAHPTPRHLQEVLDQVVGDQRVRRHPFEGRRLHHAVAQPHRAEHRRREHLGRLRHDARR